MKTNSIYLIFLLFFLSIPFSTAYASNNSITLTSEIIKSAETVPHHNAVVLNYKSYHQTTNYTCGPAAVMSLLHYYGRLASSDLNQRTELRIAEEMGATASGTTPAEVESWLTNHGFQVYSGQRINTDMLMENIQKGIPTIIAYDNHWLIAKGYVKGKTTEEDEIIFADSCYGTKIMARNTIDPMWLESQIPSNHSGSNVGNYIVAMLK